MNRRLAALLALAALLLVPAAAAAPVVDAPQAAPLGIPFLVRVCVEGQGEGPFQVKTLLRAEDGAKARAWQEGVPVPADRYGPPLAPDQDGRACRDVALETMGPAGPGTLEVKVRPAAGGASERLVLPVALVEGAPAALPAEGDAHLLDEEGHVLLRLRAVEGALVVPRMEGAHAVRLADGDAQPLPSASAVRIAEVRANGSVVLRNAGGEPVFLGAHRLVVGNHAATLPAAVLAPGARLEAQAPSRVEGRNVSLLVAGVEIDRLQVPRLGPGRAVDREGRVFVPGRTSVAPVPQEVAGTLLAYATPHAGAAPVLDLLASAREEILLEGYTLTSPDVAAALLDAKARGVRVRILLEGAPVGGIPPAQKDLLGVLAREGVEASLLRAADGFPARFAAVHAKTLVVDRDAVLVATENLHESSYPAAAGPHGTRGFGLVVRNATLARLFAEVFENDAGAWPDVAPVPPALPDAPRPLPRAGASAGPALRLEGRWNVTPVFAPEAGTEWLPALLASANRSVDVAMLLAEPDFDGEPSPFLEAALDAARRGARVRLLLDGHLDPDRNGAVADALNARAAREGLPFEARLSDPARTLHAKLVLVDGARSYVGSMNWGEASATRNREAGLVVVSDALAGWHGEWFEKEWAPAPADAREVPIGGPAWMALAAMAAGLIPRPRAPPRGGPRGRRTRSPRRPPRAWRSGCR